MLDSFVFDECEIRFVTDTSVYLYQFSMIFQYVLTYYTLTALRMSPTAGSTTQRYPVGWDSLACKTY